MKLVSIQDLSKGDILIRRENNEFCKIIDFYESDSKHNYKKLYAFSGFCVPKPAMYKFFETSIDGSFRVFSK